MALGWAILLFVFKENTDAQVSLAEISRRAGVGILTLYRNCPSRRELLEARYTDEVDAESPPPTGR